MANELNGFDLEIILLAPRIMAGTSGRVRSLVAAAAQRMVLPACTHLHAAGMKKLAIAPPFCTLP